MENPRDGGAWWAAIYGVTQSRTRLKRLSSSSSSKQYNGEGDGTPLQYSCLENSMDRGAWWAAVHGVTKSRTQLSNFNFTFHFSLLCIGEGNSNPLQYSCLENPRDRGAWWAAIYGVTQSRTPLKRLSSSRLVITFLPRNKHLLISRLQSAVILEPKKIV